MLCCALLRPSGGHTNPLVAEDDADEDEAEDEELPAVLAALELPDPLLEEPLSDEAACVDGDRQPIRSNTVSGMGGTGVCLLLARATRIS